MAIQLTITHDPTTNQVSVTGPIDNRAVCYMLLELARDVIQAHTTNGLVQPVKAMPAVKLT